MDLYQKVKNTFLQIEYINQWPVLENIFVQQCERKPSHWKLPVIVHSAFGGRDSEAVSLMTAIGAMQISILLVDDLLDNETHFPGFSLNIGETANLALALQSIGDKIICRSTFPSQMKYRLNCYLDQMMLETALGQQLDINLPGDEQEYWHSVRLKSVPFFKTAFLIGAAAADVPIHQVDQIAYIGGLYGEMIQIQDDLGDSLSENITSDWIEKKTTLPILFAKSVNHPDREEFLDLYNHLDNTEKLKRLQQIIITCGGLSYAVDQFMKRLEKAKQVLENMEGFNRQPIQVLLEDLAEPVSQLIAISRK